MIEQITTLIPGLTASTALLAILVCFGASVFGGMSGFGSGLLITLFLTPIVGAKAVIPMASAVMLITNASRVVMLFSAVNRRMTASIALMSVPMAAVGANVFVRLDSHVIQLLLGIVLIVSLPARRWLDRREIRPGRRGMLAIGGIYGFLSATIVGAGMLILPVLMGSGLAGTALLATDAAIALLTNIAKVAFFGSLDALSLPMLIVSGLMGLAMIPGTWLAVYIVRRTSIRIHTAFVEIVVLAGAVGMIFNALS